MLWFGSCTQRTNGSTRILEPIGRSPTHTLEGAQGRPVGNGKFLPNLAVRNVLLHEDNPAACFIMRGLRSRSPAIMIELRRLWYLLDSNGIYLRPMYIRSAENFWADTLSQHVDNGD
jgi:hypothetical protein